MTDIAKNYIYVDAFYESASTGKRTRWVRMKLSDVYKQVVLPSGNRNAYASVQRYKDAVSLREVEAKAAQEAAAKGPQLKVVPLRAPKPPPPSDEDFAEGQMHYHGVFFDFDCKAATLQGDEEERSIQAVGHSLDDARKVVSFFQKELLIPDHLIQCWFSGMKGFHVIVRPEVLAIIPHRHLTAIVKMAILQIKDRLELPTLDTTVYSKGRQWRIPNSIHPKSGLFKYELSVRELLDWDAQKIRFMARAPRGDMQFGEALPQSHVWPSANYQNIEPVEGAANWWQQFLDLYDVRRDMDRLRPQQLIIKPVDGSDDFPACIQDLMNHGPKPTGPNRNKVLLPMAGFFVDAGLDRAETTHLLVGWTKHYYPDPSGELPGRIQNAQSVIAAAYGGRLHFSCRAIRANSGTTAEEKVACTGADKCPWINKPSDQDPVQVPTVHLSEANKGCYIGTKVRTPVQVAALASAPFGIPLKGKIECGQNANEKLCAGCACGPNAAKGTLLFDFSAEDDKVLELIGVNNNEKTSHVRAFCKIPHKCFQNRITYSEMTNLEEVELIPMVDYSQIYMEEQTSARSTKDKDEVEMQSQSAKHVIQRGFHMGHGIQPNKKYMVEANVFNFPKDQRVCLLFDKAEPAQNDIEQFMMTPDRYENLKVFRPREGQTVEDKMQEIHEDLTANVHQIGGRMDMSIAVDLCYHSAIGFQLDGKWIRKGWWELLVVGDTGSGKSTMVDRMIQHYGLGEMTSGEGASRTGLVFATIQMNSKWTLRWGKIPQNDRRLLVIDELSGMPEEEFKKLTQIRSDGRAIASGVVGGHEAWARTRMIFLSNPRGDRGQLSDFNSGILAVKYLFKESADLRRVDLAVICESNEVTSEMVNKRWTESSVRHYYTADLCRSLLMWVWSRNPEHIEWQEGAEERVAHWAKELGEVYKCDIPLATLSDLRMKIARISCSVASRLFSTDADAKKVLVKVEHVDYAANFMDWCYRKPSMAYFEYARNYKEANTYNDERKALIKKTLLAYEDSDTLIRQLTDADFITKPVLSDLLNLERSDMDKLWKFLNAKGLIRKNYKAWRKTPAFSELLKDLSKTPASYRGALGKDFASGKKSVKTNGATKQVEVEEDDGFYAGPIPTYEDDLGPGEPPPY